MPIIHANLLKGRTREQKRAMAAGIADVLEQTLGVDRSQVRILIHEVSEEDFSIAGETVAMRTAKGVATAGSSPTPGSSNPSRTNGSGHIVD